MSENQKLPPPPIDPDFELLGPQAAGALDDLDREAEAAFRAQALEQAPPQVRAQHAADVASRAGLLALVTAINRAPVPRLMHDGHVIPPPERRTIR